MVNRRDCILLLGYKGNPGSTDRNPVEASESHRCTRMFNFSYESITYEYSKIHSRSIKYIEFQILTFYKANFKIANHRFEYSISIIAEAKNKIDTVK